MRSSLKLDTLLDICIKLCGAGLPRYQRNSVNKAMDQRARLLPADYWKKVTDVDREYYGTVPGQVGPL